MGTEGFEPPSIGFFLKPGADHTAGLCYIPDIKQPIISLYKSIDIYTATSTHNLLKSTSTL